MIASFLQLKKVLFFFDNQILIVQIKEMSFLSTKIFFMNLLELFKNFFFCFLNSNDFNIENLILYAYKNSKNLYFRMNMTHLVS